MRFPKAGTDFQAALNQAVEQNPRDLGYPFSRRNIEAVTVAISRRLDWCQRRRENEVNPPV